MSISNAVIFMGNTGVGKSYLCNRLFTMCGSSTRFKSSAGNLSETAKLQSGQINHASKSFTIVDSPGFFDISKSADGQGTQNNDGTNVCKLVKALETYKHIYAIVFVFTDRFSTPHKMWFERMQGLVRAENCSSIILLHNKQSAMTAEERAETKAEINIMLGCKQQYFDIQFDGAESQFAGLLTAIASLTPFELKELKVPEIAYQETVESDEYDEVVAQVTKDEGKTVINTKDTSHYESNWEKDRDLMGLIFGSKHEIKTWVPSTATEEVWTKMEVTRRWVANFKDVFKVRFDGTKDLVEKRQLSIKEEVF